MHPNKYTLKSYSEKLLEKHPFSNIEVIEMVGKGEVLVKTKYGICKPSLQYLLKTGSCSIKASVNKTQYFINQAKEIHGNLYDYSKTVYVDSHTKLKIICKKHEEFEQYSYKHLIQKGCVLCSFKDSRKHLTSNSEIFIKKANIIHGKTYDYTKTVYINAKQKLKIICKIHGEFLQNANNHLSGQGCNKCGIIRASKLLRKNLNTFIKQANKFHKNKYNYSISKYINTDSKITIICPIHGKFKQTPSSHLKSGCNKCGNIRISNAQKKLNNGWSYSIWEKKGLESKNFDSFKIYIIECWNETEKFYKIGKTFNKIEKRFSNKTLLPYNFKILKIIKGLSKPISKLEHYLHKTHFNFYYTPKIYFEGNGECFSEIDLNMINEYMKINNFKEEEL